MGKVLPVHVAGSGDPDLVNEIMGLIDRYCKANGIIPSPVELRDTLLAVAVLTHLRDGTSVSSAVALDPEDFAEAARAVFRDVTGMLAIPALYRHPAAMVRH